MVPRARLELAWPEGPPGFEPGASTGCATWANWSRRDSNSQRAPSKAPPLPLGYATRWSCGRDSNPHWRPSQDRASTEVGLPQDDGARGRIRTGTARRLEPSPLPRLGYASEVVQGLGIEPSDFGVWNRGSHQLPRPGLRWCRREDSNLASCGSWGRAAPCARRRDCGGRTRTDDLRLMRPARTPAPPPRVRVVLRRGVEPRLARLGGAPPVPPGEACGDLPASRTPCRELRRLAPRSAGQANGAP